VPFHGLFLHIFTAYSVVLHFSFNQNSELSTVTPTAVWLLNVFEFQSSSASESGILVSLRIIVES